MPSASQKIGVVVVTFNARDSIGICLSSLQREISAGDSILVIDNASQDETASLVRKQFPKMRLILNDNNSGFSKAVNQGIKALLKAGCEYILLLNPDTKMEHNSLSAMIETLAADPKRAVVQPLLTLMSDPKKINTWGNEYRGFGIVSLGGHGRAVGTGRDLSVPELSADRQIDYASGACMLVRASVFKEIGLLDEGFFLYFEDTEFSDRVKRAGYEIWLSAGSRVQHDYHYPLSFHKLKHLLKSWHHYCFHRFS